MSFSKIRQNLYSFQHQTRKDDQNVPIKSTNRSISIGATSPIYPPPNLFKDPSNRPLHKTQSNVEKITAMLVSQNLMGSRPTNGHVNSTPAPAPISHPTTATTTTTSISSNRVTININQINGAPTSPSAATNHRQKDNTAPINGILKNGTSVTSFNGHTSHSSTVTTPNGEPRNISFGNM